MKKILLFSLLNVFILFPVKSAIVECCGVDEEKFTLEDISINAPLHILLQILKEQLQNQNPPINLFISGTLDLGDDFDHNELVNINLKKPRLSELCKALEKETQLECKIKKYGILIGTSLPEDKPSPSLERFNSIIIPKIKLPPPPEKGKANLEKNIFQNYIATLEAMSKEYDKKGEGVKIQTIFKTEKSYLGNDSEDWLFNILYRLPKIEVSSIPFGVLIEYICQSANLKYEVASSNTIKIFSYDNSPGPLFVLPSKYLDNDNKVFANISTVKNDASSQKFISDEFYELCINPAENYLCCGANTPINSFLKAGINKAQIFITDDRGLPPVGKDLVLKLIDSDGKIIVQKQFTINTINSFSVNGENHFSHQYFFDFELE